MEVREEIWRKVLCSSDDIPAWSKQRLGARERLDIIFYYLFLARPDLLLSGQEAAAEEMVEKIFSILQQNGEDFFSRGKIANELEIYRAIYPDAPSQGQKRFIERYILPRFKKRIDKLSSAMDAAEDVLSRLRDATPLR